MGQLAYADYSTYWHTERLGAAFPFLKLEKEKEDKNT